MLLRILRSANGKAGNLLIRFGIIGREVVGLGIDLLGLAFALLTYVSCVGSVVCGILLLTGNKESADAQGKKYKQAENASFHR